MNYSSWYHLEFRKIVDETRKALYVQLKNGNYVWIPLSIIADADDYRIGNGPGDISVRYWWAFEKGLVK